MTKHTEIQLKHYYEQGTIGPDLFDVVQTTTPEPQEGEVLIKQTYMSLDPAMLGWMMDDHDSYIPPMTLGEVMRSNGIGEVVASKHPDFAQGERVMGMMGWCEYAISNGQGLTKLQPGLNEEMALSVLSLPGLTAVQGLLNIGQPKSGETLVVTGAAGSVGSIVGQLGKACGLRVIGVVGSEEKADWIVNDLGFDGAINYKTDNLAAQLEALTPDKIDVFFENTGGPIQEVIFNRMNTHGRIVVCGMIADYQAEQPRPGPNWITVIKQRLSIQGFAMPDHLQDAPALIQQLMPYVQSGKIQYRAHVLEGLVSAVDGLNLFFSGENKGKLMVKL
ncbi:NADP-dependent oxidoreductase [Gilvimarinus agarilyticus]|uniref:NADP-dependent oxidoreductase n=1 Tax=Gilvimarinus sp. 2_MG-2023 TaxID=3062666 RepID=UPI001C085BE3|nr:NADP-dependent oxidoreductase [Gilvimarinus sp. 2_MG-2023]MBU2887446.1 NADP-dependent oxidoreductase [Gilvimarinus agarilyticus]MDO6572105.1 NADP-dependent oxidoreductase [Gilvimarinus sp. 2_MG-2023]